MMTAESQRADPFEGTRTWRGLFYSKGWWHSFELPDGTKIPGVNSLEGQRLRLSQFPIPDDLRGKRVLDIGAWDGWFSFEMERRGAEVMAVDNWDNPRFHQMHRLLDSRVEYRQFDMYELTPSRVGRFDIVLFMGVLYHLKHPLLALERVCALTREMAAVDSFVLREHHLPGHAIETLPVMAFYETDEFAGQTDNWVGPTVPCLLAFCRSAGFARVELRNVLDYGACIACYREWDPPAAPAKSGPKLLEASHSQSGSINFDSASDTYLTAYIEWPAENLARDDVKPEVGKYGVHPIEIWPYATHCWQVAFRLPPGLTPGWHDVRVRIRDSEPSNPLRVAVDLPLDPGPLRIAGVRDGATWLENSIDLRQGRSISIWVEGLPENADRNNVRVFLNDVRLEVPFLSPAGSGEPRQLNATVFDGASGGAAQLFVEVGASRAESIRIDVKAPDET